MTCEDKLRRPLKISSRPWPGSLVIVLSQYAKVVGSIPIQDTYKNQSMNAQTSGTTDRCFSLFPSLSKSDKNFFKKENKFQAFSPFKKLPKVFELVNRAVLYTIKGEKK